MVTKLASLRWPAVSGPREYGSGRLQLGSIYFHPELTDIAPATGIRAGWVVDSSRPELLPEAIADTLNRPDEMSPRGVASHRYAVDHFSPDLFGSTFDRVLSQVAERSAAS